MVGKPALVWFILAAGPGTSAATVAQVSLDQLPSGLREALIATEEAKLTASDGGDHLGFSVSLSGDTALVGALDDHGSSAPGSAYVFVRNGTAWTEQAKLTSSDAAPNDQFGYSVGLSGDTALVGAQHDDHAGGDGAGSAYAFVRNGTTWTEQAKLTASDAAPFDEFGCSVSLSGDTAVVGAMSDDGKVLGAGSAYVFVRSGAIWIEQAKLTASNPVIFDLFGNSVSVSDDTTVVGASGGAVGVGVAYVFVRSGTVWTEQARLTPSHPSLDNGFGASVSLSGDTAVVGAELEDNVVGAYAGSAYVFVRDGSTWTEQQKLVSSDLAQTDSFGYSAAVSGDTIVIGAPADDHVGGKNAGSAYVFVRNGTAWTEQAKLTASDAAPFDFFGWSVGLSGDTALVGAVHDDHAGGDDAGSAYVFRLSTEPPVIYCTAGTSASGCQALLSASGTPSATAPSGFTLSASTVEGQKDGLFFWGKSGKQANPWGNGTSYQCVAPPVTRGGSLPGSGTIGACDGSFVQDLNATWCSTCPYPQKNPGAGAVVQAQLWYRDPLSTSNQTTSLSDAIEFGVGL